MEGGGEEKPFLTDSWKVIDALLDPELKHHSPK
jgi:hypothetical protein